LLPDGTVQMVALFVRLYPPSHGPAGRTFF